MEDSKKIIVLEGQSPAPDRRVTKDTSAIPTLRDRVNVGGTSKHGIHGFKPRKRHLKSSANAILVSFLKDVRKSEVLYADRSNFNVPLPAALPKVLKRLVELIEEYESSTKGANAEQKRGLNQDAELIRALSQLLRFVLHRGTENDYYALGLNNNAAARQVYGHYQWLRRIFWFDEGDDTAHRSVLRVTEAYLTLRSQFPSYINGGSVAALEHKSRMSAPSIGENAKPIEPERDLKVKPASDPMSGAEFSRAMVSSHGATTTSVQKQGNNNAKLTRRRTTLTVSAAVIALGLVGGFSFLDGAPNIPNPINHDDMSKFRQENPSSNAASSTVAVPIILGGGERGGESAAFPRGLDEKQNNHEPQRLVAGLATPEQEESLVTMVVSARDSSIDADLASTANPIASSNRDGNAELSLPSDDLSGTKEQLETPNGPLQNAVPPDHSNVDVATREPISSELVALRSLKSAEARKDSTLESSSKRRVRFRKLLADAEAQLAQSKLTRPKGNNAHETYKKILVDDPENSAALHGLQKIAERYEQRAKQFLEQGAYDNALTAVERGLSVLPDQGALTRISSEIYDKMRLEKLKNELPVAEVVSAVTLEQGVVDRGSAAREEMPDTERITDRPREVENIENEKAALTDTPEDANPLVAKTSRSLGSFEEKELTLLLERFTTLYGEGDLSGFLSLFSAEARTNDRESLRGIGVDYRRLFRNTTFRHMRLLNVEWQAEKDAGTAKAKFELVLIKKQELTPRVYSGQLTIDVKKRERNVLITGLYHEQDRVERVISKRNQP